MNVPHPDPEQLTLAALPAEPDDPAVTEHLAGCAECRAEVAELRLVVDQAREGGIDSLPAPPARVWDAVAAELGLPPALRREGVAAPRREGVTAAPGREGAPERNGRVDHPPAPPRRRRRRVLVPVVAALLGLLAGLGIGRAFAPAPAPAPVAGPVVRLAPVGDLDPAASGTVAMADEHGEREMIVQVAGVTNIAGGDHLEAWLMDSSGTRLVPLGALDGADGTFHGTFALPPGLPLAEFGRVDVSAERWDGNPGHSTRSVLRGAL